MSSPWAKIATPEPVNFEDILSEEIAKEIQSKEDQKYAKKVLKELREAEGINSPDPPPILFADENATYKSDEAIAKMLQKQYDLEYDDMLKKTENKFNGDSKVSISFSNYRRAHDQEASDLEEDGFLEDPSEKRDWDRFDYVERQFNIIPSCGYRMKEDGTMVTKHDMVMSGTRNACKMMNFPPDFHTGDGAGFDLQMSNKVFNSLKIYSSKEEARRKRMKDKKEDRATAEFGIDQFTRILLFKIINNRILENINGIISIGKEAVILHAESDPSYSDAILPKECVVKVYKTILSEFKQRDQYIRDDYRFTERMGKQTMRKTMYLWAEKEMHNLNRMKRVGIPCPEVVYLKHHVLVMSFIGENHKPAPKLKNATLDECEYEDAYHQVIENMKILYQKAKLIHADLSEYNILWYKGKCYFIDVGQSTEPRHIGSFGFLMRDCENVCNFFQRKGVPNVIEPEKLFFEITGCEFADRLALEAVESKYKAKPHLANLEDTDSPLVDEFEETWQRVKSGELAKTVQVADKPVVPLVETPAN
ncbi:serine/threonine-protein kinase RIO3 [Agrilus planipennis]|uniref:Serine/threonine-protein kinase RIO3 n=1 Tax=Agrilus planipennis TaxID=224129 RepID=A0A1W4X9G6_AGRPL|nr:serine/threonine-protein kinase RIO3 [Agrilus planipennis]